jgi:FkbM family methyltransferase
MEPHDVIGGVIDAGEYAALDAFQASWREHNGGDPPMVWDVGANVGDYALCVLRRLPTAHVWAFEPQKGAYSTLARTFAEAANVRCGNIGLSSEDHEGLLHKTSHPACYLASTVPQSGHRLGVQINTTEPAQFVAGANLMEREGVKCIDWLKLDTEGHELEVLRGFGDRLVHDVQVVQFEYNLAAVERGIRFMDLWTQVTPMFEVYRLDEDGTVTFLPEYDEGQEGDKGGAQRNYLCVHIECDWFAWEKDRPVGTADCRPGFERDTGEAA